MKIIEHSWRRTALTVTIAACLTVGLGACSRPSPSASAIPSAPTATTTPTVQSSSPAAVQISANDVAIVNTAGERIDSRPYTSPMEDVVGMLDGVLGPHQSIAGCAFASWGSGDGVISVFGFATPYHSALVQVNVKTAQLGQIRVQSSIGFAVGDDVSPVLAALPESQIDSNLSQAVWQTGSSSTAAAPEGAVVVFNENNVAVDLFAPGVPSVRDYCD